MSERGREPHPPTPSPTGRGGARAHCINSAAQHLPSPRIGEGEQRGPEGEGDPPASRIPRPASRLIVLAVLALALLPQPVSGHAALLRSDPTAGSSLAEGPDVISLWFTEAIEIDYSGASVVRADGSTVATGDPQLDDSGPEQALTLRIDEKLERGSYTVVWTVLSSVDGHVTHGFFSFTVGDALPLSPAAEAELALQASSRGGASRLADGAARWLSLLGQLAVAGTLVFLLAVAQPLSGPLPARRWRWLFVASLLALVAGHLASAVVQTMNATRQPLLDALGRPLLDLLTGTRYGALWLSRATLVVALALTLRSLAWRERLVAPRGNGAVLWGAALVATGLLLLTTSLGSHAAARSGDASWQVVNDWLHQAGASVWVGGLLALALALLGSSAWRGTLLRRAVARFSVLAGGSVALLLVTGVLAARQSIGGWDGLTLADYGTWFQLKLALVVAALGLGAWHLLVAWPEASAAPDPEQHEQRFRWTLRLEAALAIAVLLATAALTVTPPGRDLFGDGGNGFAATRLTPEMSVTLRVEPGRVGANEFTVDVGPVDEAAFGELQRVYLRFTPLDDDGQPLVESGQRAQLRQSGPAESRSFRATGAWVALDGRWEVVAIVRRAGVRDVEVPFLLTASERAMAPEGVPLAASGQSTGERLTRLSGLWLLASLALGGGAWWLRRSNPMASATLATLAGVALLAGAAFLILGGPGA